MRVINKYPRLNVAFFFALLLGLASCGGGIPKDEFDALYRHLEKELERRREELRQKREEIKKKQRQ